MKRKGLTIFLVSAMTLLATPRAVRNFQNFVASAQDRVKVELLSLLVSIGSPMSESPESQPSRTTPDVANARADKAVKRAPVQERVRHAANNSPAQNIALSNTFVWERAAANDMPAMNNFSTTEVREFEQLRRFAFRPEEVLPELAAPIPSVPEAVKGRAVAMKLKTLLKTVRVRMRPVAGQELQKELNQLIGACPSNSTPAPAPVVRLLYDTEKMERARESVPQMSDRGMKMYAPVSDMR